MTRRPLAIDLFSGLGGWAEGLEAAGWDVIRVDIEDMFLATGTPKPPVCLLMLQDVLTFHGSQAKGADLIVCSPPCQRYSYMAMPWTRAKDQAKAIRADETGEELAKLNALFDACFRIQREACAAAGRHIPMVVENVRGAQPWVGRARWNYGSYYLWGDVPALMPPTSGGVKVAGMNWSNFGKDDYKAVAFNDARHTEGRKLPGFRFDGSGGSFQSAAVADGIKVPSLDGESRTKVGSGARFTSRLPTEGQKAPTGTRWFNDGPRTPDSLASSSSKSSARKAASARIAKIPLRLSTYIGEFYKP